jgi:hypothetical protein
MDHVRDLLVQAGREEACARYAERVRGLTNRSETSGRLFDANRWCQRRETRAPLASGYDDLGAVGSPAGDGAVSPPAPLLEGSKWAI